MSIADLHNRISKTVTEDVSLLAAEFTEGATSVADRLNVSITAFHTEKDWGPCRWTPRVDDAGDTVLPVEGDRCVVALAESGSPGMPEIWVVAWWPS
jgi:hypothetical protein